MLAHWQWPLTDMPEAIYELSTHLLPLSHNCCQYGQQGPRACHHEEDKGKLEGRNVVHDALAGFSRLVPPSAGNRFMQQNRTCFRVPSTVQRCRF